MRYVALATDYDGTLATHGEVDAATLQALHRFLAAGGKLLLITGRELPDLKRVFPHLHLFTRVVAENGALLFDPATERETLLCPPVPKKFVADLRRKAVPLSVGRAIVATMDPHLDEVRHMIAENGLELQISLNKGSIMVLPAGVNKATGLHRALAELGVSPESVVGIGDAENDTDFLEACGYAAAVANALPALKSRADVVTGSTHGAGVVEIMEQMLADNLIVRPRPAGCD